MTAPRSVPAAPRPEALEAILSALRRWQGEAGAGVLVVALDGYGASGKSTIAEHLQRCRSTPVVHTDDFFRALGPLRRGELTAYYDLGRLRAEALEPLRAGRDAVFRPFDWSRGRLAPAGDRVVVAPGEVIVVDGVCSAAPALADLVDRAVFVDTPEPERLRRLEESVDPEAWDEEWLVAERAYFAQLRPVSSFDLVVSGSGVDLAAAESNRPERPEQPDL